MLIELNLQFGERGYIAHPFWHEQKQLISIQKVSGYNRVRSEQKRAQVLLAELEHRGLTLDQYNDLQLKAKRPFVTDERGTIVIPADRFCSFLSNIACVAPRAVVAVPKEQAFVVVDVKSPGLTTGKQEATGIYSRFVKNEESNERMLAEDPFIGNFTAAGVLVVAEEMVNPEKLKEMIEYGGKYVGIGSARAKGYGRFKISKWKKL
jgi:hypothetical protein